MSKYESSVKQVPHSQAAVYQYISNLNNLSRVRDRMPEEQVKNFNFDNDSVGMRIDPVGELRIRIVDREEPKCVKFESVQSPVHFNLWIQVLPVGDEAAKLKVTVDAELNPFIRAMVSKPLQEGVEKLAETLAIIPYENDEQA